MHITKLKKPIWKGYKLCDSDYMTFCVDDKKNQWLPEMGWEREMNKQSTNNFRAI